MIRTPVVVGNWKMNGTLAEARALAWAVRQKLAQRQGVEVVLCPPFTALAAVAEVLAGSSLGLGAQNCHWEAGGAFTGEVSPSLLADLGCRLVILGHSERRQHLGESDAMINRKLHAALSHGLTPLLCVGETAEEHRRGLTSQAVEGQLRRGLAGSSPEGIGRCMLAYEPVWAIGTGVNATPAQAAEVHGCLRGLISQLAPKEVAQAVRILYGGSVKPENTASLLQEPEVDGVLVGGASLEAEPFVAIVKTSAARGGRENKE